MLFVQGGLAGGLFLWIPTPTRLIYKPELVAGLPASGIADYRQGVLIIQERGEKRQAGMGRCYVDVAGSY
jgi:hypothetical protein